MSSKHRNYPELPTLGIDTPDGRKEQLKPMLCAEAASEIRLSLSLGVAGDVITHHYTLGLQGLVDKYNVTPEEMGRILQEYSNRLRARIKLDAVLLGTDLWLRNATFKFPLCQPLVVVEPEETWMKMASGQIRPDHVQFSLAGETKPTQASNTDA